MRLHEIAQHCLGLFIGLAIAAMAIDYGRQSAPRSTPVLSTQLTQD